MSELKLYQIADDLSAILATDDWTEETEAALELLQHSLEVKVGGICEIIRIAESQAAQCKEEEQRIAGLRKAREKKAAWLRDYLLRNLEAVGRTEVVIGTRTVKVRENPESVEILDGDSVPAKFKTVVTTTTIGKNEIKAAMKAGEFVPGAVLVRGKRLEVK